MTYILLNLNPLKYYSLIFKLQCYLKLNSGTEQVIVINFWTVQNLF